MKQSIPRALFLILFCSFTLSVSGAESRESRRIRQGKITKNEAQHLVIKKFPGARIKKCELKQEKDRSVWVIEMVEAGAQNLSRAEVDGQSGKVTP